MRSTFLILFAALSTITLAQNTDGIDLDQVKRTSEVTTVGPVTVHLDHYIYDHDTIVKDEDENLYKVENLGDSINSRHMESGPIISPDGNRLYYFKIDSNFSQSKYSPTIYSQIYFAEYVQSDSSWTKARKLGDQLNGEKCPNSVLAVVNNGNTLLLSNQYHHDGLSTKGLSISHVEGEHWTYPEPLKVDYNTDERFSAYMNDEMTILILAIHDKNSIGHQDLFVSFSKDKKKWSAPKNLGTTINTELSEGTAFLAEDGKTLFFSSNGHPGSLGGFDVYRSERLDDTWVNWSTPVNIGAPYNTKDDELHFSFPAHGDYSYLAHHFKGSDKAFHSDIVRIRLMHKAKPKMLIIKGHTVDAQTQQKITAKFKITLIDQTEVLNMAYVHMDQGFMVCEPIGKQYKMTFEALGYETKEITIDAAKLNGFTEKELIVALIPELNARVSGFLYSAEDTNKVNGTITLTNKANGEVVRTIKVSAIKGFDFTLKEHLDYEIMASSPNLLEDILHLNLTNEKGDYSKEIDFSLHCLKCSFEVEDIFFGYNKSNLLPESFEKLDQVVKIMKKHTGLKVELSAHTDARGSGTFNKNLSQKRAESVVKYLIDHGVLADQLIAVGYGEDKIRNQCDDGITCSEEEHEYNRRVEFKVLESN